MITKQIPDNAHPIGICISAHVTSFPDPLILSKGEVVKLGNVATEENWKNWIWAENAEGHGGWVPLELIEVLENKGESKKGFLKEAYSSKELNVQTGDRVHLIKSLSGWTWVKHSISGEEGWIPDEVFLYESKV